MLVESGDFNLSDVLKFEQEGVQEDSVSVPLVNPADTKQSFEERAL